MSESDLTSRIKRYINKHGGVGSGYGWYVGITSDPLRRLFTEHKVNKKRGAWIYGTAATSADARRAERYLLNMGCEGGEGGGGPGSKVVYAYHITWYTSE